MAKSRLVVAGWLPFPSHRDPRDLLAEHFAALGGLAASQVDAFPECLSFSGGAIAGRQQSHSFCHLAVSPAGFPFPLFSAWSVFWFVSACGRGAGNGKVKPINGRRISWVTFPGAGFIACLGDDQHFQPGCHLHLLFHALPFPFLT